MSKRVIKLDAGELSWLCEQLALIQRSGLQFSEGIDMLKDSSDTSRLKLALDRLSAHLKSAVQLSQAMSESGSFPPYLIQMVHIGEVSGRLDTILSGLAQFYLRDSELRKKTRNALIYPSVLLVMMLAVIVLLIVRVLPVFNQILSAFGGTLPAVSRALMSVGTFLERHFFWLLPLLFILILILHFVFKYTGSGRRFIDQKKLVLPIYGPLYRQIVAARFASSLHHLLVSGVELTEALSLTAAVMDNDAVSSRIEQSREKLQKGEDLFAALKENNIFPVLFIRMLVLANRAGELDQVMGKIAASYDTEVNDKLARFAGLVEPFLVTILSLIVALILLTVMLPLIELMSSIG